MKVQLLINLIFSENLIDIAKNKLEKTASDIKETGEEILNNIGDKDKDIIQSTTKSSSDFITNIIKKYDDNLNQNKIDKIKEEASNFLTKIIEKAIKNLELKVCSENTLSSENLNKDVKNDLDSSSLNSNYLQCNNQMKSLKLRLEKIETSISNDLNQLNDQDNINESNSTKDTKSQLSSNDDIQTKLDSIESLIKKLKEKKCNLNNSDYQKLTDNREQCENCSSINSGLTCSSTNSLSTSTTTTTNNKISPTDDSNSLLSINTTIDTSSTPSPLNNNETDSINNLISSVSTDTPIDTSNTLSPTSPVNNKEILPTDDSNSLLSTNTTIDTSSTPSPLNNDETNSINNLISSVSTDTPTDTQSDFSTLSTTPSISDNNIDKTELPKSRSDNNELITSSHHCSTTDINSNISTPTSKTESHSSDDIDMNKSNLKDQSVDGFNPSDTLNSSPFPSTKNDELKTTSSDPNIDSTSTTTSSQINPTSDKNIDSSVMNNDINNNPSDYSSTTTCSCNSKNTSLPNKDDEPKLDKDDLPSIDDQDKSSDIKDETDNLSKNQSPSKSDESTEPKSKELDPVKEDNYFNKDSLIDDQNKSKNSSTGSPQLDNSIDQEKDVKNLVKGGKCNTGNGPQDYCSKPCYYVTCYKNIWEERRLSKGTECDPGKVLKVFHGRC